MHGAANRALRRMGPTAVDALIETLRSGSAQHRCSATVALGGIGPEANVAVTQLIAALQHAQIEVQREAARALGRVGTDASAAIPELTAVLQANSADLSDAASVALSRIGSAAIVLPALVQAGSLTQQTICASHGRQIGMTGTLYVDDYGQRFPDQRDLKASLPGGNRPWQTWPRSDPRSG